MRLNSAYVNVEDLFCELRFSPFLLRVILIELSPRFKLVSLTFLGRLSILVGYLVQPFGCLCLPSRNYGCEALNLVFWFVKVFNPVGVGIFDRQIFRDLFAEIKTHFLIAN